jgi:hypothetical protein
VLTMLVQLAEELKITILIVGHFNKNSNVATALDKPGGCRAWTAVPRSVWGFFRQADDRQQRVMVNLKLNNAKEVETGLLFTIGGCRPSRGSTEHQGRRFCQRGPKGWRSQRHTDLRESRGQTPSRKHN